MSCYNICAYNKYMLDSCGRKVTSTLGLGGSTENLTNGTSQRAPKSKYALVNNVSCQAVIVTYLWKYIVYLCALRLKLQIVIFHQYTLNSNKNFFSIYTCIFTYENYTKYFTHSHKYNTFIVQGFKHSMWFINSYFFHYINVCVVRK